MSVRESGYGRALRLLRPLGRAHATHFFNVIVVEVDDPAHLLATVRERVADDPDRWKAVARIVPVERTFTFDGPADLERQLERELLRFLPRLAQASFQVRTHRRGVVTDHSARDDAWRLEAFLLDELAAAGHVGTIGRRDPDVALDIEIVGSRAGVALFTRDELRANPFLPVH